MGKSLFLFSLGTDKLTGRGRHTQINNTIRHILLNTMHGVCSGPHLGCPDLPFVTPFPQLPGVLVVISSQLYPSQSGLQLQESSLIKVMPSPRIA